MDSQRVIQLSDALKHDKVDEFFLKIFANVFFVDHMQKITNLDIALNEIDDQGVSYISDALRENQVIL